jgi:acyl-CoA thioesterase
VLDPDDFRLDPLDGGFARDLPARWCFGDRAFGGYTAALALDALLTSGPHHVAASLSVTFLEAGVAGPVTITVEPLRSGRSATASRATVHQHGRPILSATAWLVDGWADDAGVAAPSPVFASTPTAAALGTQVAVAAGATAGAPLAWLAEHWPPLLYGERTGIDYPTSWEDFARGRPEVALWARVVAPPDADPSADPLPFAQLADVLHLDGHLFDAPGQITSYAEADLISLDLSIAWQPGSHRVASTAWRLIECRGSLARTAATSYASVRDEHGALLAVATSQGVVRR